MPDALTPEEQQAIEAATAAGMVQKIARGASSYAGYYWCEEKSDLLPVKPMRWNRSPSCAFSRRNDAQIRAKAVKVERARKLHDEGYPQTRIAAMMGLSRRTVRDYLREPVDA